MKKPIRVGFDLGNRDLKIAAVQRGELTLHTLSLPEHLMEDDAVAMPHAFSAFLKKAKKELRLPGGPAGLILPSSQVICRLVTMPRMSVDQLLLNLPYEFSDFIRGEPHQYHCDYAFCEEALPPEGEEAGEEMTMMAAAAQRQQIQDYIGIFAAGGFSLRLMLPQEMALLQLLRSARQRGGGEEVCFIDLGYLSTRIFVLRRDRLQATRRIPAGGRDLETAAGDVLHVDPFLAGSCLRQNYKGILDHPRCAQIYEHIAVEALKLVNFYRFTYRQNQLEGVYLIGGGAEIAPLGRLLEETLDLPVRPAAALFPGGTGGGVWASAAGLVLGEEE